MTEDGYTKRLNDIRCDISSLWESVDSGDISAKDNIAVLSEIYSDLSFIIDEFMDLELDELLQLGAE
tara:strand:- start:178 stop:378 length:201 start_codon:yes stop_codon:yes gene_type:complete